jgi:hypothetical protein
MKKSVISEPAQNLTKNLKLVLQFHLSLKLQDHLSSDGYSSLSAQLIALEIEWLNN